MPDFEATDREIITSLGRLTVGRFFLIGWLVSEFKFTNVPTINPVLALFAGVDVDHNAK